MTTPAQLASSVRFLSTHLQRQRLIEQDTIHVLKDVANQIEASASQGACSQPWQFAILPSRSMRFQVAQESGYALRPDIYCHMIGSASSEWPVAGMNLVVRVWSLEERLNFRTEWDAMRIKDSLRTRDPNKGRVLLRFRLDLATQDEEALRFHLQMNSDKDLSKDELSWLHHELDVPRLWAPPMDLVLASELIVANFFPKDFKNLRKQPEWRALVRRSESIFLQKFFKVCYEKCGKELKGCHTLLTALGQWKELETG